jgi:hypothetical protein
MVVHSLIITNPNSHVLFSRHFIEDSNNVPLFEKRLFQHSSSYLKRLANGIKFSVSINDVVSVFEKVGEFFVFICGTWETDEILRT